GTAALTPVSPAGAQRDDSRNAATWYWRAINQLDRVTEEELWALREWALEPGAAPPPSVRSTLNRLRPALDAFYRGAEQEHSDFGLDLSQGWDLLLPHLGKLRSVAIVANADVQLRLHDGDSSNAAKRLAGLYQAAQHLSDDRTLISSLVGQAIYTLTDQTVQYGIDAAAFDAGDASVLLHAAKSL